MKTKSLNWERILKQVLPSAFFVTCIAFYMGMERGLAFNLVFAGIGMLVLCNVFIQNKAISRVLGVVFLLASLYMCLALFDDIADGEATLAGGYWVVLLLVVLSVVMSVLLIVGYRKGPSEK